MRNLFRIIITFLFIWLLYTGNPDTRDFQEYVSAGNKSEQNKFTGQEAVDEFLSTITGKTAGWAAAGSYERKNYVLLSIFVCDTGGADYLGIGNTFFKLSRPSND